MCRLASFPAGFPQDKALEILLDFERSNTDGVGCAYVDKDGNFVTEKWPTSISKIIEDGKPFLSHMADGKHKGWTIAHLRAASHGEVAMKNTHPFIINDKWAFCHNGVWSDYKLVKAALGKTVKFGGETDTEVAGHLFNIAGARAFTDVVDSGGVFMGLRKDGALYACRTSGQMAIKEWEDGKAIIASEFPLYDEYRGYDSITDAGWFYFSKTGRLIKSKKKDGITYHSNGSSHHYYAGNSNGVNKWLPAAYQDKDKKPEGKHLAEYRSEYSEE